MEQIHKRFTDNQLKDMLRRYLNKEIERKHIQATLGIGKSRFFELVSDYRQNPKSFSIQYVRATPTCVIDPGIEKNILKELSIDKKAIQNKEVPLWNYNYSYVKERLEKEYGQTVSVPTIIDRAKKNDFYFKKRVRKTHDRQVITNYVGELIQHDSSFHLWAPDSGVKWYLITSLDDYSRYIIYAAFVLKETVWTHILALQTIALSLGLPHSFYVDCHAIFRFVRGRDELHYKHHLLTDEVDTQWKQVLDDCQIKPIYALSPQAKGKIERPYRWLQDHIVRTCIRHNIKGIEKAHPILEDELHRYNDKRIHSTTGEVPNLRFQRALKEKQSLFREFGVKPPFQSPKDIFALRMSRVADAYRRISINNLVLKFNGAIPGRDVDLRIHPLNQEVSEVRFWLQKKLVDVQTIKNSDLKVVHF